MPTATEPSGLDLARLALQRAKIDAKRRGETSRTSARPTTTPVQPRLGREPNGLAEVVLKLLNDRGWELPAAGGTLRNRWDRIARTVDPSGNLAQHTWADGYDPQTQQLRLGARSASYATQLRLLAPQIVAAVNADARRQVVRDVHVLRLGSTPAQTAQPAESPAAVRSGPAVPAPASALATSTEAQAGARRARAALHAGAKAASRQPEPQIAAAIQRQVDAMRRQSNRQFPDDGDPTKPEDEMHARRRESAGAVLRARRRARDERAATHNREGGDSDTARGVRTSGRAVYKVHDKTEADETDATQV
ncbi:DUF721 domain-containing protein [Streptomyces venezuelae]|uniref:DUF721 domain-containing protein n=1 Tax=Streptomyces venezuelae TaxID=54571 RepID=UPI0034227AA4